MVSANERCNNNSIITDIFELKPLQWQKKLTLNLWSWIVDSSHNVRRLQLIWNKKVVWTHEYWCFIWDRVGLRQVPLSKLLIIHDNYVAINVDKSNTDQLRKGNEVVIAKGSNPDTCLVKILSTYLARIKQDPLEHDNYIFRPLRKSRSGHKLVSVNKPLSYSTIRDHFKASFKDIVPDISRFGTHSLRAGGASAAANAGVNDRLFQRPGRWKTVSAMNGYVDDNLESRLTVSKMLGI